MTQPPPHHLPTEADLNAIQRACSDEPMISAGEVADIEREAFGRGVAFALSPTLADAWARGFQDACDEVPMDFVPDGPTDAQNPYLPAIHGEPT